jgi:16S rRNA processing protein RimM
VAAPLILMGVVGRPHGVRGLVHVHSYTEEPTDLARYSPLLDERGRRWSLTWRGEGVAELSDADGKPIADRSAAERLVNMRLSVERDRLPAPEAGDFYLADLIGLEAVDQAGAPIGEVVAVHDYGAGTSLEIERANAAALLVPFTRTAVPDVNVAQRKVIVVPPEEIEVREAVS